MPDERGSVLMLMPAAVLIVLLLGALAVDRAIVFEDQRDLVAIAQAAADDAAASGLDADRFRTRGERVWDRGAVRSAIERAVSAGEDPSHPITLRWSIEGEFVVVSLSRRTPRVFTASMPGGPTTVHATARAELLETR